MDFYKETIIEAIEKVGIKNQSSLKIVKDFIENSEVKIIEPFGYIKKDNEFRKLDNFNMEIEKLDSKTKTKLLRIGKIGKYFKYFECGDNKTTIFRAGDFLMIMQNLIFITEN